MKTCCKICGREQELTKIHKDYQRLAADPEGVFICPQCSSRLQHEALKKQLPPKPLG